MKLARIDFSRTLSRRIALAAGCIAAIVMLALPAGPARAQNSGAQDRIIVSGASGNLGGLTVEALLARGVPANRLILVSRTPETLQKYGALGASLRFGDFTQPESLPAAYQGGSRMLLISVGGQGDVSASELLGRAINVAKSVGVRHIAYTSYVGLTRGDVTGRAADHQATEALLEASGLEWTMLRNSIYMDGQMLRQARTMVESGRGVIPPNESPIGFISRADCAAAAAAVLVGPGHENRIYDVTGPDLLGVSEIAAIVSDMTGEAVEVSQGGPDTRPGFGRPAMAFTTTHFEGLTGRPPMNARAFFAANRDALFGE
jgi:NAD(P)H dehydrogenase (quinone)